MSAPSNRRRLPIAVGCLAALLMLGLAVAPFGGRWPGPPAGGAAGIPDFTPHVRVRFVLDVKTKFAYLLTDSTRAERRWMRRHYAEMRGYPPYHDRVGALRWAPPTDFYDDLYASLRTDPLDR